MSSKKVTVRRRELKRNIPKTILAEARNRVGSVYFNQMPLRGLSAEEEKKYLPNIIGVEPEEREFRAKANNYWANMGFNVPMGGYELEVGKDDNGRPINIQDWIYYRWCLVHPLVGNSESEMNDPNKTHWIEDPDTLRQERSTDVGIRIKADTAYLEAIQDEDKIDMVLSIMMPQLHLVSLSPQDKINTLYTQKEEKPKEFLEIATDKRLEYKSELARYIQKGIISKVGSIYIYLDITMGHNENEAIAWLKDKKNSEHVLTMKQQLEVKELG